MCTAAGWPGTAAVEQVRLRTGSAGWRPLSSMPAGRAPVRPRRDGRHRDQGRARRRHWRVAVAAASFAWVDTGNLMPAGTDTVVEHERVRFGNDGSAQITGPAPRGRNVRASGEDFAAELLIPAGHRLRGADLAAAATAGHATLEVARRPVVADHPDRDEIRPVGSALGPGDVTDSNSLLLASQATEAGAWPVVSDVQPDDPDAIAAEIRRAALAADIVLVIAGSSAGRSDHTAAVVARTGGLAVRGAAIRPATRCCLATSSRTRREPVSARWPFL